MRHIFCAVGLMLLSSVSMAIGPSQVLLVREDFGGNPPPHMAGWGTKIVVYQNGVISAQSRQNGDQPWQERELGTLSEEVINGLMRQVADLKSGELVYPEDPECYDMPSTTYTAYNALNESVEFAAEHRCITGKLAGFYQADFLSSLLNTYASLAYYSEQ